MKTIDISSKIKIMIVTLLSTIAFTACGGGDNASFSNSETLIDITIPCETTPDSNDISSYITLNSGDVIVKDTNDTKISIYHDVNGTKKVCLTSGSAHIIRQ